MRGLLNLGNTCYFNTAIQVLAHCSPLTTYILHAKKQYIGPCHVSTEYQSILCELFNTDTNPVHPGELLRAFHLRFPKFADNSQHDAQEVILCLLDLFEKSFGKEVITSIFNGEEIQETIYPDGKSEIKSSFTTLILDVTKPCTLKELMDARQKHSMIAGYTDRDGKVHNAAAVSTRITKWPQVAMFSFSMYAAKYGVIVPNTFEGKSLFACVLHSGNMYGGHYAALINRGNKWFVIDDENISPIETSPLSCPFYMAFYVSLRREKPAVEVDVEFE